MRVNLVILLSIYMASMAFFLAYLLSARIALLGIENDRKKKDIYLRPEDWK